MVMVVECGSCHSRFRVKKSLLEGAFAIRFRCRSCGGFIVVRNPEMHKIAEVPAAPAMHSGPGEPVIARNPAPSDTPDQHVEPDNLAAASTFAPPNAHVEPEKPLLRDRHVPWDPYIEPERSDAASAPSFPGEAGPGAVLPEDLVPAVHWGEKRFDRDTVGGAEAGKRVATGSRPLADRKRSWAIGVFRLFAGLGIILLLASGAYYLGAFNPWGESTVKKDTLPPSSNSASAPSTPAYEVRNLDAYIPREAVAGNLFVITGTVRNMGSSPTRGIRIQATLFGTDNQVLMRQETRAGSRIDKYGLSRLTRVAIEEELAAARTGAGTGNHDVPPGASLPFIVVCFDPPGVVESYEVLATNAGP